MKIVIPGGSGQVGTILARAFRDDGHDVVVERSLAAMDAGVQRGAKRSNRGCVTHSNGRQNEKPPGRDT
jgi:hypothetical protein